MRFAMRSEELQVTKTNNFFLRKYKTPYFAFFLPEYEENEFSARSRLLGLEH